MAEWYEIKGVSDFRTVDSERNDMKDSQSLTNSVRPTFPAELQQHPKTTSFQPVQ